MTPISTDSTRMSPVPSGPAEARPARRLRRVAIAAALTCTGALAGLPVVATAAPAAVRSAASPAPGDPAATAATEVLALLDAWQAGGDLAAYVVARDQLATVVADRIGVSAEAMRTAWADADAEHQRALLSALTQLGVPYRRNTSKPGIGFDCSGLTTYAWAQAGFTLPRSSGAQIRNARAVDDTTAQAGDLVHYPGHVMMWLGVDRAIIHSPQRGKTVEVDVLKRRTVRFGDPTG